MTQQPTQTAAEYAHSSDPVTSAVFNDQLQRGLVSVVMPTHNCLKYLPKAIASVLEQTHQSLELIIVNDRSSDGSADFLAQISDPRVKVIDADVGSPAKARNIGLCAARGEWVALLDADDFWYPNKLVQQITLHRTYPELALSFTNYDHLTEQYDYIIDGFGYWDQFAHGKNELLAPPHALEQLLVNNIVGTSTVMMNRRLLKSAIVFDESIPYGEDWDLWLKIAERYQVGALNSRLTGYLMRQGSVTQTDDRRLRNLKCVESIFSRYFEPNSNWNLPPEVYFRGQARILEGYADFYRQNNDYPKAISMGWQSLKLDIQKRRIRSLMGDCRQWLTRCA